MPPAPDMDGLTPINLNEFDAVKVVILKEVAPLTDRFQQIVLTKAQFRIVLAALTGVMPPDNKPCSCGKVHEDGFMVTTNDDHEYVLKDIPQWYTHEQIKAMDSEGYSPQNEK